MALKRGTLEEYEEAWLWILKEIMHRLGQEKTTAELWPFAKKKARENYEAMLKEVEAEVKQELLHETQSTLPKDYTAMLAEEYSTDKATLNLIATWRKDGMTDEEIYETLAMF